MLGKVVYCNGFENYACHLAGWEEGTQLLPEVSLFAILVAQKQGFLRAKRSLIQTIGLSARNVARGQLYTENVPIRWPRPFSKRIRAIEQSFKEKNGMVPKAAGKKATNSILRFPWLIRKLKKHGLDGDLVEVVAKTDKALDHDPESGLTLKKLNALIDRLEAKMKEATNRYKFDDVAIIYYQIKKLRQKLKG